MMELRTFESKIEIRQSNGKPTIRGRALAFEQESVDFGGFREVIDRNSLNDTDMSDVRALFNHDKNLILGRTTNGTLKLTVDERGLVYEITPPDNDFIRSLVISPIERGDITQSSFGFLAEWEDVEWEHERETPLRRLMKIRTLKDISPVTFPAYEQTEASIRSFHEFNSKNKPNESFRKTVLEIIAGGTR